MGFKGQFHLDLHFKYSFFADLKIKSFVALSFIRVYIFFAKDSLSKLIAFLLFYFFFFNIRQGALV